MKAFLLFILIALQGCASVVSTFSDGHPNRDQVPITPGSRAVMLTGTYADADWDGWVTLPRGAGAFKPNNGIIQDRDGKVLGYIEGRPTPILLGNVIYGGIPGALGDCAIGGAWDLQPYPYPWGYK